MLKCGNGSDVYDDSSSSRFCAYLLVFAVVVKSCLEVSLNMCSVLDFRCVYRKIVSKHLKTKLGSSDNIAANSTVYSIVYKI